RELGLFDMDEDQIDIGCAPKEIVLSQERTAKISGIDGAVAAGALCDSILGNFQQGASNNAHRLIHRLLGSPPALPAPPYSGRSNGSSAWKGESFNAWRILSSTFFRSSAFRT